MKYGVTLSLIALLAAAASADPIRYDQISADAVGYFHVDGDQLLASRLSQLQINGTSLHDNIEFLHDQHRFWSSVTSATMYSLGKSGRIVVLMRGSAQEFHDEFEVPRSTDTVVFVYDRQEVHFSASCLLPEMFGNGKKAGVPADEPRGQLNIGLGGAGSRFDGSFYTAYVGKDLIVVTIDLPSMATALDVLNAKKPSLANQDPQGLKIDAPAGVIAQGAGLSAQWTGGNVGTGASTRPVSVAEPGPSDFGMDLFGSFKGKTRLARFDMGENQTSDYADASFKMIDSDSAQQLMNLLLGIKALVSMSKPQAIPFIDPLQVQTAGNDVRLHWSLTTAKLSELIQLTAEPQNREKSLPASVPSTQPAL